LPAEASHVLPLAQTGLPTGLSCGAPYSGAQAGVTQSGTQAGHLSFVTLKIYDILGREVATLVNTIMYAGFHTVGWNAVNLPSGIYYYKLSNGNFTDVKKMLLTR
jgi:hypothetical protein